MSSRKKIAWRVALVKKGILCGKATDWSGVLKEVFASHSSSFPSCSVVKREENFALYQVGARKVWFPLAFDPSFLGFVYHETFEEQVYENGHCRIAPGHWVVDAGACEGFFSQYALEKGANLLAFEPVPEIAQALERTLRAYIDAGRAIVLPLGLGRERAKGRIFLHTTNSGGATLNQAFRGSRAGDYEDQPKEVPIDTLDGVVSDLALPVSFLKADVEGYERELLLGARETISHYRPCLSVSTYHLPDDYQEIPRIVRAFGTGYHIRFNGMFSHMYGVV